MLFLYIFLGLLIAFAVFYKFIFLRDNQNLIPKGNNIASPASGKIISIQTVDANTDLKIRKGLFGKINTRIEAGEKYYLINIFMSPFDVHFTKMPYAGKIQNIERKPGKFFQANSMKAALENEKQEFLIETELGLMKVIQIAGFLARRTRSFTEKGQELLKGDKLGIILLASQTALLFPKKNYILNVKVGDRVSSGETIISYLDQ